jgi:O-antigen/teichoic acid export membrane protein
MARVLLPKDYGIVSLSSAIVSMPSALLTEGFASALVQRDHVTDDHINVAFWANSFLSVLFVSIFIIAEM